MIASRIEGLAGIVGEGVTGVLFQPVNATDLTGNVRRLWEDLQLRHRMGRAGREKVIQQYSQEAHFHNLVQVYQMANHHSRNGEAASPC